jgi:hypothetical protein
MLLTHDCCIIYLSLLPCLFQISASVAHFAHGGEFDIFSNEDDIEFMFKKVSFVVTVSLHLKRQCLQIGRTQCATELNQTRLNWSPCSCSRVLMVVENQASYVRSVQLHYCQCVVSWSPHAMR